MDGHPNPKTKTWRGQQYSETRYYVIKWLEQELPKITGKVLNVASGNWPVPKQLLTNPGITSYLTYDKEDYGNSKNSVDMHGDVYNMPPEWTNSWDCVICNQAIECFEKPFAAMDEMYRIIKPGGILLIDGPFNYRWFGDEAWPGQSPKKHRVFDYWRISKDGWEALTSKFSKSTITGFGGTGKHDRFVYCVKAVK